MRYDVISLGLLTADLPVKIDAERFDFSREVYFVPSTGIMPGGDATNAAVALTRFGRRVALVSAVGADVYGDALKAALREKGLSIDHIATRAGVPTTFLIALINSAGDRTFLCEKRGACGTLCLRDFDMGLLGEARHLNYGSLYAHPAIDEGDGEIIFRAAKEKGLTTSADAGSDGSLRDIEKALPLLRLVDLFMPSYVEARSLTGLSDPEAMMAFLLNALGDRHIVIKLGGEGCLAHEKGGKKTFRVPALEVPVVDTTGAGDNFAAGAIHMFLSGAPLLDCVRFGSAAAAVSIGFVGATTDHTTLESVGALARSYHQ